ncbi:MAG: paraquat-inducible protein A [Pseudomonadales bacterium]|nr:paraquat-inducible protein A [Pseudomonadales bacterium]MCP5347972.1 paraquat-inducible protein A [Pseudomonadales bacterium]
MMIIVIGLVMLIAGLFMPVATTERLLAEPDTYSILGGIRNLLENGNTSLALAITGFSVIFPIAKYIVILLIALRRGTLIAQGRVLRLLRFLGKWSMLDTFVIAVTFGAANLGILSDVQVRWGIYLYGAAVLISILVSVLLSWSLIDGGDKEDRQFSSSLLDRLLHTLSIVMFLGGLMLPLAQIDKWLFWENHYSVATALARFLREDESVLALLMLLFVVLMPLFRFLLVGVIRWLRRPGPGIIRLAELVDEWAMFDVYVLAMGLVFIKLNDHASVTLQMGFWLLAAAACLTWIDSARLHRQLNA